jgi:hypothetical protein
MHTKSFQAKYPAAFDFGSMSRDGGQFGIKMTQDMVAGDSIWEFSFKSRGPVLLSGIIRH